MKTFNSLEEETTDEGITRDYDSLRGLILESMPSSGHVTVACCLMVCGFLLAIWKLLFLIWKEQKRSNEKLEELLDWQKGFR